MLPWYFFALATMFFSSIAVILTKKVLFKEHAMEFAAAFAIMNFIITIPLLFNVNWYAISLIGYFLILGISLCSSIAYLLVVKATRHTPISFSSPLMATAPAITGLLAFIFLKEKISLINSAGIALVIFGVILLEHKRHNNMVKELKELFKQKYVIFIFLALLIYGISSVFERFMLGPAGIQIYWMDYFVIVHAMIAIIFLIMISIIHNVKDIFRAFKTHWVAILFVSIFTIGYRATGIFAITFEEGKVALVGAIKRSSVLLTSLIGGRLFHEEHILQHVGSAMVIILGVILIIL